MYTVLFDLNFEKLDVFLLSFIPALINIGIFIYVLFFQVPSKTNRNFSFFVLLLGFSQLTDGIMRMSVTEQTALIWNRMAFAPWIFTLVFGLNFLLRFTGWHKKINQGILILFMFIPAMILELVVVARLDQNNIVRSETWNWISNPESSFFTDIIYAWIAGLALLMLGILWVYYFRQKRNTLQRKQALLLALGFSFSAISGIISEIIFPLLLNIDSVPLVTPAITIFSITALIAIKKYKMLNYSPKRHWDKIIETMNEGIVIVNNEDQIMYVNKAFCDATAYQFDEVEGKSAADLLLCNEEDRLLMKENIDRRKMNISDQYELEIKKKNGKSFWSLVNGSPYYDQNGK